MKPDKNMKLADLMYGHGSKFMCSLSGRFDPEKYSDAPPIQICEMKCGCWIVADGNNRVGLILKKNPEATIADIPERLLATARFGEWDAEMMDWWNPCAKSFGEVMGKRGKKAAEGSSRCPRYPNMWYEDAVVSTVPLGQKAAENCHRDADKQLKAPEKLETHPRIRFRPPPLYIDEPGTTG